MSLASVNLSDRNNQDSEIDTQAPSALADRDRSIDSAYSEIATRYRNLDAAKVVHSFERLGARIEERFPNSGLATVCHELTELAGQTQRKADLILAPNIPLRVGVYSVIAACVAGLAFFAWLYFQIDTPVGRLSETDRTFLGITRLFQTGVYLVSVIAAAIIFLISIEHRIKRRQTLRDLHELRSIAHVIDMHQLTKDPGMVRDNKRSKLIARRPMTKFELTRYLDYCSEMLALTSKLAAIYAQHLPDPIVIGAVNDLETLTANLSREIWQKISILENYDGGTSADRHAAS